MSTVVSIVCSLKCGILLKEPDKVVISVRSILFYFYLMLFQLSHNLKMYTTNASTAPTRIPLCNGEAALLFVAIQVGQQNNPPLLGYQPYWAVKVRCIYCTVKVRSIYFQYYCTPSFVAPHLCSLRTVVWYLRYTINTTVPTTGEWLRDSWLGATNIVNGSGPKARHRSIAVVEHIE